MKPDLTKIYLEAMRRVAEGEDDYSCSAISYDYEKNPAALLYAKVFSPDGKPGLWQSPFALAVNAEPDSQNFRVLMLGLMAACWRDMLPLMEGR